jgi:hypothetical protein
VLDGDTDGDTDGVTLGEALGDACGVLLSEFVGDGVGEAMGVLDKLIVGLGDGLTFGDLVTLIDGVIDGDSETAGVADGVGVTTGVADTPPTFQPLAPDGICVVNCVAPKLAVHVCLADPDDPTAGPYEPTILLTMGVAPDNVLEKELVVVLYQPLPTFPIYNDP